MEKQNFKWLYVVLPIAGVAILGSVFVNIGMTWFNGLNKPTQWIPNIVIPIVWSVIYLTFTVILIMWTNREKLKTGTLVLLIINGVLNVLWCLTFFTLRQTFLGNIVIILNLIFGFWLIFNILKNKQIYGLILMIYPIWLSIATTLNLSLWILN